MSITLFKNHDNTGSRGKNGKIRGYIQIELPGKREISPIISRKAFIISVTRFCMKIEVII